MRKGLTEKKIFSRQAIACNSTKNCVLCKLKISQNILN